MGRVHIGCHRESSQETITQSLSRINTENHSGELGIIQYVLNHYVFIKIITVRRRKNKKQEKQKGGDVEW